MKKKKEKHTGRKIFLILIVIAFALIFLKFSDLTLLYHNLQQGRGDLLLVALGFMIAYYLVFTLSYAESFKTVGINTGFKRLFPLIFGYIFINVVAPTGGVSGPALFATEAAKRKQSPMKTLAAVLLANIAQFVTFICILFVGLFYLAVRAKLETYQVIGAILMLLLTGFLIFIVILGIFKPSWLRSFLHWFYNHSNRVFGLFRFEKRFEHENIESTVEEFSGATLRYLEHPRLATKAFVYATLAHFVILTSLFFIFLAFNELPSLGVLIVGYVMGVLFQIIGITPYGIGLSEGAMTFSLASIGVPTEKALLITLTFRGLSFWLPFLTGFILLRKIHIFGLSEFKIREVIVENRYVANLRSAIRGLAEYLTR